MWDGWHCQFDADRIEAAQLEGYRRTLHKASTTNWGDKETPCPTLNIEPSEDASCIGCAFRIHDDNRSSVLGYLARREGSEFELRELPIIVPGVGRISAFTSVLRPTSARLDSATTEGRARLIQAAKGKSGRCYEYFINLRTQLLALGIADGDLDAVAKFLTVENDAGAVPLIPPDVLKEQAVVYHVTSVTNWPNIQKQGLLPKTRLDYLLSPLRDVPVVCLTIPAWRQKTIEMIQSKNDGGPVVVLRVDGEMLAAKRCALDYTAGWISSMVSRGVPTREMLTEAAYLVCLDLIAPEELGVDERLPPSIIGS